MATGIVSVALRLDGAVTLSRVLLALTGLLWLALAGVFLYRLASARDRWVADARRSASLTAVAGTAVLGTRLMLLGSTWAPWLLLAIAAGLCAVLLPIMARALPTSTTGAGFLAVVALQSLSVLSGDLAARHRLTWLAVAGLGALVLGLGAYLIVLARFDFAQLRIGRGDHWVSGGALAISTLASANAAAAGAATNGLTGTRGALDAVTTVLWALTIAWLPALVFSELRWPRPHYEVRRWGTVFPLGMYAAMSFATARVASAGWIAAFARGWTWVAFAVWVAVAIGAAGEGARKSPGRRNGGERPLLRR